jgi:acyl-CoA thioesterase FadM
MGRKSVEFRHELIKVASGQTVMGTKFKCVLLDLEKRAGLEIPPDIRERMAALVSPSAS